MDNINKNEKEKWGIDDKWLEDLQNEIKEQREDLDRSKRIDIKREKVRKIYEEALRGDSRYEPEDVIKYIEDRINSNDEEEKEEANIYINALKELIVDSPKIEIEKGNENNMDENKIVQALTEAFMPMFERIENRLDKMDGRLDNLETDMKDVKVRLTNVENDVRSIKLQIETHVIPALNAQNEGRHIIMDRQEEILESLKVMGAYIRIVDTKAEFPELKLAQKYKKKINER